MMEPNKTWQDMPWARGRAMGFIWQIFYPLSHCMLAHVHLITPTLMLFFPNHQTTFMTPKIKLSATEKWRNVYSEWHQNWVRIVLQIKSCTVSINPTNTQFSEFYTNQHNLYIIVMLLRSIRTKKKKKNKRILNQRKEKKWIYNSTASYDDGGFSWFLSGQPNLS